MKPARKRVSLLDGVNEAGAALRAAVIDQPKAWVTQARERMKNLPKTNFELGVMFAEQGKWMDALFRFRVTEFLQADYPLLSVHVGSCYFRMGRQAEAKKALLKALRFAPDNQAAIFMLASIDPSALPAGKRAERMPKDMVIGFFTAVAEGYDIEEATLKYQAGKISYDLLKPLVGNAAPAILDLGCGTGIVSRPWRLAAGTITGVDFTPAMVAAARKATHASKTLFDMLIEADITQLPTTLPEASADAVLVVNVVQFVGELSGIMTGAARALKPGGAILVTMEPHTAATGFGLNVATGRFGHSAAYLTQTASSAGLKLVNDTMVELYPTIQARAMVFTKGTN